ncbi:MAG TPA: RNB domain-containing ribonuclease [Pyrinomonadaceae bacterium]|nr:RNB domain-containing ribonuclease [Pyrinomonadaceae bacterium]
MVSKSSREKSLDLSAIADQAMIDNGFVPEFPAAVKKEVSTLEAKASKSFSDKSVRDLRELLWSSIDDPKTRDLDQVEYAEPLPNGDVRLLIGIADVDAFVPKGSATDKHAGRNCTSVYAGVKTFPMLPEELSTDLTSLVEGEDRLVVVTEMTVCADGSVQSAQFYRAIIQNKAKLSYEAISAWLESETGPPKVVKSDPGLEAQIRLQWETAERLAEFRKKLGAIDLGTIQAVPVMNEQGRVIELKVIEQNSARELIANYMIAANVEMAEYLESKGGPSLRRIVRRPKYWDRIVEIADELGEKLPPTPDSRALAAFLERRKKADPLHFPDLSLAVVKSLGPGEYAVQASGEEGEGHFGLAVQDYTHSTAPNRRYVDLITQRLVKAALQSGPLPYDLNQLKQIAEACTDRDNAARKVERKMRKVAAALLLDDKIGQVFDAIVTGASEKGTFARVLKPPVDGRIMRGERGLRVGDKVRVRLLSTDPERGFIDFAKA